jgi:prepilin-type processing-associated H-X9-DG protein
MTAYEVVAGPNTIFPDGEGRRSSVQLSEITDGTSNTILVGEAARPVRWTEPDDIPIDTTEQNFGFSSFHPGGWNSLMADGSVRFLKNSIAAATLKALLSRNGGEVIAPDSY